MVGLGTHSLLNRWASLFLGRRHSKGGPPPESHGQEVGLTAQMFVLYVQNVSPIKCHVSLPPRREGLLREPEAEVQDNTV